MAEGIYGCVGLYLFSVIAGGIYGYVGLYLFFNKSDSLKRVVRRRVRIFGKKEIEKINKRSKTY